MKFSEKIVRLRKIKGITQDEFANAVGVSRQAVYKWECGQSYPEASKLIEIKALFGISIDDLLDDSYEVALPEKKKRKRISKVKVEKTEKTEKTVINEVKEENALEVEVIPEKITVIDEEPIVEISDVAPVVAIEEAIVEEVILTVTDEAEKIIEEVAEKTEKEPTVYEEARTPVTEEKTPRTEVKQEVKKRGFFSRIFGRK